MHTSYKIGGFYMWKNGVCLDNKNLANKQREYLDNKDYKGYLRANYEEDRLQALNYLLKLGITDRRLWKYAYSYATKDYDKYFDLLKYFMDDEPKDIKVNDNGSVTVYRGITENSSNLKKAYSWTTSKKVAEGFSKLNNSVLGRIYTASIHPDHIITTINERKEKEVILNPSYLVNVEYRETYPVLDDSKANKVMRRNSIPDLQGYLFYECCKEKGLKVTQLKEGYQKYYQTQDKLIALYGNFLNNLDIKQEIDYKDTLFGTYDTDFKIMKIMYFIEKALQNHYTVYPYGILNSYKRRKHM